MNKMVEWKEKKTVFCFEFKEEVKLIYDWKGWEVYSLVMMMNARKKKNNNSEQTTGTSGQSQRSRNMIIERFRI